MFFGFGWDRTMILLVPAILLSIYSQIKISAAFRRYSRVPSRKGLNGAQVARMILQSKGLYDVQIEPVRGRLSDHYDPRTRVVRLSEDIYSGTSLAAVAVAAHETGHALQHAGGYFPLQLRSTFVPLASFGSVLGPVLILAGFFLTSFDFLLQLGIIAFSFAVLFQLITLPVEYNASNRAMTLLLDRGMLEKDEVHGVRSMLNAAALTYVAAALVAVLELARFIIIAQGRSDD